LVRIGLISDIHGNLMAFDVVLQELATDHVDQLICLGDVASLGPQPREVIERLRQAGCPVIMGNTDAWLLKPPVADPTSSESTRSMFAINHWCSEQLSEADKAYISAFPATLELPLDERKTLLCFHGSPRSFNDVIAAVTPDEAVSAMLMGSIADVMTGGHTHIQMVRRYEDSIIVNVGSIGLPGVNAGDPTLPMNHNVQWAEYGLLTVEQGHVSIELRRTPIDVATLLREAHYSGMPHLDWWIEKWHLPG
jgi:predicted phosphodiesterase